MVIFFIMIFGGFRKKLGEVYFVFFKGIFINIKGDYREFEILGFEFYVFCVIFDVEYVCF